MTVTEFTWLDTEELHLVAQGANGFPALLAKARAEVEEVLAEDATKDTPVYSEDGMVKFVSAAARRKYAESGVAMSNGDFPIPDEGHLRSAIGRVAEYKGDRAKAKAHIIKRARALGLVHLLPKEWHVTKEVSTAESLSQTHEVSEDVSTGGSPDPGDGGAPRHMAAEDQHVDTSEGQGDVADMSVPKTEALSQTRKAEGDGTGDPAPDDDDKEKTEAESQTREDAEKGKKKPSADSDPGSPEWEAKDVALGEKAEALIEQLSEVVRTFTEREKAEGGSAKKEGRRLSGKTDEAIRRCIQALSDLLENTHPSASKEALEMTNDELIKLLDERDAARRAEKSAKTAKKEKAAKKAAKAEAKAAKGADASKAVEDGALPKGVAKALTKLSANLESVTKTVDAIASQDAKRVVANAAGLAAVPRGTTPGAPAFKELEERVERAITPDEARTARFQLAAAKMVANENARAQNPGLATSQLGPNAVQLFKNTGRLGEDSAVQGI